MKAQNQPCLRLSVFHCLLLICLNSEAGELKSWDYTHTIHPKLPEMTFRLLGFVDGKGQTRIDAIEIFQTDKSATVQKIPDIAAKDFGKENFIIEDMNFDGYKDIRLVQFIPAAPNIPFYYWFYNPGKGAFIRNHELDEVTSPEFDQKSKLVRALWRDGCCVHGTDIYQFVNGHFILAESEEEDCRYVGTCQVTQKKRVGNEMKTVKKWMISQAPEK